MDYADCIPDSEPNCLIGGHCVHRCFDGGGEFSQGQHVLVQAVESYGVRHCRHVLCKGFHRLQSAGRNCCDKPLCGCCFCGRYDGAEERRYQR